MATEIPILISQEAAIRAIRQLRDRLHSELNKTENTAAELRRAIFEMNNAEQAIATLKAAPPTQGG